MRALRHSYTLLLVNRWEVTQKHIIERQDIYLISLVYCLDSLKAEMLPLILANIPILNSYDSHIALVIPSPSLLDTFNVSIFHISSINFCLISSRVSLCWSLLNPGCSTSQSKKIPSSSTGSVSDQTGLELRGCSPIGYGKW